VLEARILWIAALFFLALFQSLLSTLAQARDFGQWEQHPAHIRQWFQMLMQPDEPTKSCCGEADAYEADMFEIDGDQYVAIITNGAGDHAIGKPSVPNGTRVIVPNSKLKG
jgi:hypothetical protein